MLGLRITSAVASVLLLTLSAGAQTGAGLMGPIADDGGQSSLSIDDFGREDATAQLRDRSPGAVDESSIPLGAPKISELLPTLDRSEGGGVATETDQPLGGSTSDAKALASSAARTIGALTLVVALIVALAMIYKRFGRGRAGPLGRVASRGPSGLCEVLARYPLPPRHSLIVLRFGHRVLLLSHAAKGGELSTLCELDDPGEVAGVLEIVRQSSGQSINARFRDAIAEADRHFESALLHGRPHEYQQPLANETRFHRAAVNADGDRAELLGYAPEPRPEVRTPSPLRRRLESMRGSGLA